MIRVMHVLAIAGLIASALYAYSIKYETLYHAEQVVKLKGKVQRERDAIATLRAEWQHLNRPDRLQTAVERHLDLQPLGIKQLARFAEIPSRPPRQDEIGRKLEALGLAGPTATPKDKRPADPRTTGTTTPRR